MIREMLDHSRHHYTTMLHKSHDRYRENPHVVPSEQSKGTPTQHHTQNVSHGAVKGQKQSKMTPNPLPHIAPIGPPSNIPLYLYKPLPPPPNTKVEGTKAMYEAYKPNKPPPSFPKNLPQKPRTHPPHTHKARNPRPEELFLTTKAPSPLPTPPQPTRPLPPSLVAGPPRASPHATEVKYTHEVGDPGILGVRLGVYDFRNMLPVELRPEGPPLRWDDEPAPRIPEIACGEGGSLMDAVGGVGGEDGDGAGGER